MKAAIFFAFIMWSCFYDLMAQQVTNVEIVGPSEVELEEIETYSINFYSGTNITYPSGGTGYQWTYEGATLLLDTYNRSELRFDTPGPQFVAYEFMTFDGNFYDYKEVRVNEKNPCADVTVSGSDASRFGEGSLTLVAEAAPPGFIYQWFDKDSTTLLGTYREFTTPVLTSTKTYYLAYKHLESGCITGQVPVSAFISDHNYVKKYKARVEQASEETIKSGSSELSYKDFTYFDGLGRPMQQVKKHASTTGKDIVTPMIYDEYGRPFKEYLPYSDMEGDAEGLYKKDALESHSDFYRMKHGDALGFHEKMFESSPLNRIEKQAAPGESWKMGSGKEIKFGRRPNSSEDDVRVFEVDSTGLPVSSATYEAGTLWVEVTDNEDDHRTMVFTDKLGRTVLKKVQHNASSEDEGHQGWLCTYYVYDVFGNLRVVIPPKAVTIMNTKGWAMSTDSTLAAGQYFMYKYDGAKRMIEKQVPGKAPEHFVYDKKDRLVASQDGELRAKGQWHYRKYDYLNREVVTGLAEISKSRSELQEELDSVEDQEDSVPDEDSGKVRTGKDIVSNKYGGHEKYLATHSITLQPGFRIIAAENISFSAVIDTTQTVSDGDFAGYDGNVLTLSYYDDYSRTPDGAFEKPEGYSDISRRTTGLLTGKKVKDLVTGVFYSTLYFYDEKARVIQTLEGHQLGGTLRTSTRYNFEDQPMASLIQFHDPEKIDITRRYHYNRAGMLTGIGHKIGEGPEVVLASYSYDELGEKTETVFPEADGASHTFSYNIRGWLKHIGSPVPGLFNMTLDYQESDERWDGNIMKAEWKGKDGTDRNYHYSYDQPGRLTGADYEVPSTVSENSRYTLSGIDYDENGNLKAMARRGETTAGNFNLIDDLSYEYEEYSNRLSRVKDKDGATGYISKDFKPSADFGTYAYDANGNQTSNPDKQISTIRYNHLNLPEEVVFSGGGKIWYDYDAEGRKRKQRVYQDGKLLSTTDYMGELVFRDGELDYLIHEEGRVAYEDGLMKYEFFLKDHLGNVRQVIRKPETQTVLATMEMAVAEEEEQHFEQLSASRQLGPEHNVTPGGNQVAWLNAERGRILGPARTQRIYQGEKIRLTVHGKYHNPNKKTVNPGSVAGWGMKSRLEKELLEFSASTTRSASPNAIAVLNIVHLMVTQLRRKDAPEAYMMYALYDADSILYDQGKQVLTKNAANKHEILEEELYISRDGYMEAFLVNETDDDVWFDNFEIMSEGPLVIQETHYDPWGLELSGLGFQYEGVKENKYLYNGKELLDDHNLNLYDHGARLFDPAIGRWISPDPMAYMREWVSPYNFVQNNPLNRIDPDGAFDWVINEETNEYIWMNEVKSQEDTPDEYRYVGAGIQDVQNDFDKDLPWYDIFSKANINFESWPGELMSFEPNAAGKLKEKIGEMPFPVSIVGNSLYETVDNAYVSTFQMGPNRTNLEAFGVGRGQITDAGVGTLTTVIPYSKVARVSGLSAAQFSSMLKGTGINRALYRAGHQMRGWANRAYNYVYSRQIDYSIKATSGGTKALEKKD